MGYWATSRRTASCDRACELVTRDHGSLNNATWDVIASVISQFHDIYIDSQSSVDHFPYEPVYSYPQTPFCTLNHQGKPQGTLVELLLVADVEADAKQRLKTRAMHIQSIPMCRHFD